MPREKINVTPTEGTEPINTPIADALLILVSILSILITLTIR
jgi:hypothetical protein